MLKEYCIEKICGSGRPYMTLPYKTLSECYNSLMIMVSADRERHRPYYVDLANFDNEYSNCINGIYYRIFEREVSCWDKIDKYTYVEKRKRNYDKKIYRIY